MISAAQAKQEVNKNICKFKNTSEFKFAMKNVENMINEGIKNSLNFCHGSAQKLLDYKDYPSDLLRKAIKDELEKNGYSYEEKFIRSTNGLGNWYFNIVW